MTGFDRRRGAGAAASLPSRALSRSGDGGLSSEFACVTLWIDTSPSLHSVRSSPSFVAFFHAFHAPLLLPPLFPPPLESRPFFFIVIARSAQIDDATSTSASLPHSPALSPLPSCLCRKTETRRSPFSLSLSLSLHLNFPGPTGHLRNYENYSGPRVVLTLQF